MKNIHLFTNSKQIIPILSKFYRVKKIFTEKSVLKKKQNVQVIKSLNKISLDQFNGIDLAISYGFGIIFKKNFIKKYSDGIWNIHPGDLPRYRGRHPITWAFLNNEKKIGVSIHKIDQKIDRGFLLSKKFVTRTLKDDEKTINKKIFKILPSAIKLAIKNYNNRKFVKIKKGKYYKALYKGVSIKNPKQTNFLYVYNAIKAQKFYGGVKIGNFKFKDVIFFKKKKKLSDKYKIIECKNNKTIIGVLA